MKKNQFIKSNYRRSIILIAILWEIVFFGSSLIPNNELVMPFIGKLIGGVLMPLMLLVFEYINQVKIWKRIPKDINSLVYLRKGFKKDVYVITKIGKNEAELMGPRKIPITVPLADLEFIDNIESFMEKNGISKGNFYRGDEDQDLPPQSVIILYHIVIDWINDKLSSSK